ncbi:uncharacterized protein K452DRAFT_50932 [Aplosporella prunicola CBS 121167]|uniref:BTB domain-containing protein n=1 Tax=Aplosporella prunicola CBS 121167 TaxID=1176127 RepID=A0A6A6BBZ2_9PEZI|nr:uncharacterized protein K452DRAFT_50932 [Aplosporella prunicola CBS 121167]KAF2140764.1 hypothetical protein K452DRAFT_50932 [Aplosporella prunicola CBS 121167]
MASLRSELPPHPLYHSWPYANHHGDLPILDCPMWDEIQRSPIDLGMPLWEVATVMITVLDPRTRERRLMVVHSSLLQRTSTYFQLRLKDSKYVIEEDHEVTGDYINWLYTGKTPFSKETDDASLNRFFRHCYRVCFFCNKYAIPRFKDAIMNTLVDLVYVHWHIPLLTDVIFVYNNTHKGDVLRSFMCDALIETNANFEGLCDVDNHRELVKGCPDFLYDLTVRYAPKLYRLQNGQIPSNCGEEWLKAVWRVRDKCLYHCHQKPMDNAIHRMPMSWRPPNSTSLIMEDEVGHTIQSPTTPINRRNSSFS